MTKDRKISLVLADVDGTLVTEAKALTSRTRDAVRALHAAGIRFAITSGRPPLGMAKLIDELQLSTPTAGFNGGLFVDGNMKVLGRKTVPMRLAQQAIDLIHAQSLDAWVYSGNDWLITRPGAPHVGREATTVGFQPKVVADFAALPAEIAKIVGVSDDLGAVQRCEAEAQRLLGSEVTARRSQPYYLDITNKDANKGAVVEYLSQFLAIPTEEIVTIGDQLNDVTMFERSGFSIAMGNAPDEVKSRADAITASHHDEGFAKAMERFVLSS